MRLSEDLRYLLPALLLAGTAIAVLLMEMMRLPEKRDAPGGSGGCQCVAHCSAWWRFCG